MAPEQQARVGIDTLLSAAGWHVCNVADANIHAATGVAIREFPLNNGFGFADYLLYVNGKACGVIEAKKVGATLDRRGAAKWPVRPRPAHSTLPAWRRPLPFVWESTGVETHFTNGLDPEPRARAVFAFFRPELLVQWLAYLPTPGTRPAVNDAPGTFLTRMRSMPKLVTEWGSGGAHYALWPAQISAITNLEKSLAANKPKALIQMATGSGKTFTSIGFIYRLIKFGGARRVLFWWTGATWPARPKKSLTPTHRPTTTTSLARNTSSSTCKATSSTHPPAWSSAPSSACSACSKGASWPKRPTKNPPKRWKPCSKTPSPLATTRPSPSRALTLW
jgi:type I restriction enzyme R subunit